MFVVAVIVLVAVVVVAVIVAEVILNFEQTIVQNNFLH